MPNPNSLLRNLPSVHELLEDEVCAPLQQEHATQICRSVLQRIRNEILDGSLDVLPDSWSNILEQEALLYRRNSLKHVINATGIVIHTNLGRAPLPLEVVQNISDVARGYSNVEIDLKTGKRGGRLDGIQQKVCRLTGAEDCIVVNNNAAATLLAVSAVAAGKEIVVSRGELVEIGGSFRIPDVIAQGGATMVEVGCTNKTKLQDFVSVVGEQTAAFLRVHTSNFKMVGFVHSPERKELVEAAHNLQIVVVEDLGSGLLREAPNIPNAKRLEAEESVSKAILENVDLVTFSGDKLLGGVQAGFVVGKKDLVERCRKHPLYRALRCCKLTYAALESLLMIYERQEHHSIPTWQMLEKSSNSCRQEAEDMLMQLQNNGVSGISVIVTKNYSGGGALPDEEMESAALCWKVGHADEISRKLRLGNPSILCRIQNDMLLFETRTILNVDERQHIVEKIIELWQEISDSQ